MIFKCNYRNVKSLFWNASLHKAKQVSKQCNEIRSIEYFLKHFQSSIFNRYIHHAFDVDKFFITWSLCQLSARKGEKSKSEKRRNKEKRNEIQWKLLCIQNGEWIRKAVHFIMSMKVICICRNRFILFHFYWLICVGIKYTQAFNSKKAQKSGESAQNHELVNDFRRITFHLLHSWYLKDWSCDKIHLVLVNRVPRCLHQTLCMVWLPSTVVSFLCHSINKLDG